MIVIARCTDCGCFFEGSRKEHHKLNWCKNKCSAIDVEMEYIRIIGNAEIIEETEDEETN